MECGHVIKSFEGARGIAAILIAIFHLRYGVNYFSIVKNGYIFVDLFFVLSGFVICASYSDRLKTLNDFNIFMIRRFGRLFPLLIFSTFVYVVSENLQKLIKYYVIYFGYGGLLRTPNLELMIPTVPEIFGTLTMTHGMGLFDKLILNSVSWSISTEFYAYVLFCFASLLCLKSNRLAVYFAISSIGFIVAVLESI